MYEYIYYCLSLSYISITVSLSPQEYVLLADVNDSDACAQELGKLLAPRARKANSGKLSSTPYCKIPYYIMYQTIRYHTIPYYTILRYTILHYTILPCNNYTLRYKIGYGYCMVKGSTDQINTRTFHSGSKDQYRGRGNFFGRILMFRWHFGALIQEPCTKSRCWLVTRALKEPAKS